MTQGLVNENSAKSSSLALGQGQMAGRVTENSVILQSRLTNGLVLINGDLPGCRLMKKNGQMREPSE